MHLYFYCMLCQKWQKRCSINERLNSWYFFVGDHWDRNIVISTKFSSLATPKVPVLTTSGEGWNFLRMTTVLFSSSLRKSSLDNHGIYKKLRHRKMVPKPRGEVARTARDWCVSPCHWWQRTNCAMFMFNMITSSPWDIDITINWITLPNSGPQSKKSG